MSNSSALILTDLCPADEKSFLSAIEEFKIHDPGWDFAFQFDKELLSPSSLGSSLRTIFTRVECSNRDP